jgi:acyl-CoA hydrolase
MAKSKWQDLAKWWNQFGKKELTAQEAITLIQPGQRIFLHSGCSDPISLSSELFKQQERLKDIIIYDFLSIAREKDMPLTNKPEDLFRHNAFFIAGESIRKAINSGHADYTPTALSEIPSLFQKGRISIDVALIQVSPPDKNNLCSFGVNVDVAKSITEAADLVIAEINPKAPRVFGNSFIHMKKIDHFVYADHPLREYGFELPDEIQQKIAQNVSSLVKNEATIQVGLGRFANTVLKALSDHKDLGVHTDTLFDTIVDLVEEGVITGDKKSFAQGRIVANFGLGTKKLFDFVDDNLGVEFHPSDFTNNPTIIAQNDQMTAINSALSVDLLGQVNAASVGSTFYSGIGGIADFSRGASYAKNGRPIIYLPSTTTNGEISRIVPTLPLGSHVSLMMNDIHYIVTEYGIAHLHGKNIRERALALISIAHPKFRKWLLEEAKKLNFCYSDQKLAEDEQGNAIIYPFEYREIYQMPTGQPIVFRPILPTDERLIQDLYYKLDEQSRVYRFFKKKEFFGRKDVEMDILIDYTNIIALIGVMGEMDAEKAVATCSYERDPKDNFGEIAFTVADGWRNKGLTQFMLNKLIKIAKINGLEGLKGEILWENKAMVHIIKKCGYKIKKQLEDEDWIFSFRFDEKAS